MDTPAMDNENSEVKNLLFLCTINRHRSVIAEFLFRDILKRQKGNLPGKIETSSAGIVTRQQKTELKQAGIGLPRPLFGYRPMPCVVLYMHKNAGINVSEHRSRGLTSKMVREADLIIAMGESHKEGVLKTFFAANGKIVTLAELSRPFEFPDIAPEEPPGLMPPAKFCMLQCDHWTVTETMIGDVQERLEQATEKILSRLGV
jgi:protein-tyrosine-phosphatase